MKKRKLANSKNIRKGLFDDDYTLFEDGEVLHEYDKGQYPGQFDQTETLHVDQLSSKIKNDFIKNSAPEDLELVKRILNKK